nr:DUF4833 domain-containing protein [uncultured Flavobacterium sp.]
MKQILGVFFALFPVLLLAQQGYPTPPDARHRLFYIQHSNNHNTFVYDANVTAQSKLDADDPIDVYRLTYEKSKNGIREELTQVQRKMAYGVEINSADATLCEFTLAAYPAKKLVLRLGKDGKPYVTANVNGKNIIVKRLYLQMGKLRTNVLHIDFYGKDIATGKEVSERLMIK